MAWTISSFGMDNFLSWRRGNRLERKRKWLGPYALIELSTARDTSRVTLTNAYNVTWPHDYECNLFIYLSMYTIYYFFHDIFQCMLWIADVEIRKKMEKIENLMQEEISWRHNWPSICTFVLSISFKCEIKNLFTYKEITSPITCAQHRISLHCKVKIPY